MGGIRSKARSEPLFYRLKGDDNDSIYIHLEYMDRWLWFFGGIELEGEKKMR
jgi:phenylpyruvate tautomerase PptA (4-oxalocrotonate tautomerase family)